MERRRSRRIIKRLEASFASNGIKNRGITSNLSKEGMFIRTLKGILPNKKIDLRLYLPSGAVLDMNAIVRRTVKTQFQNVKNGMGVELMDPPLKYTEFVRSMY